jgi:hypothetical protein
MLIARRKLALITNTVLLSSLLLLTSLIVENQALARCPNGTHKSPSGACETVEHHAGLPRCPNGFHRSPSGDCEQVASSSSEDGVSQSPTNNGQNGNSVEGGPPTVSTSGDQCDPSLWNHVYNPSRLQVVDHCKTVSGVIDSVRTEPDGDYHIRLKLDPQFSDLINSANVNGQYGDLVAEPICVNPVTQIDAISSCQSFHQNIVIPPIGTHVKVTGSYVRDNQHGGWAEIHPVTSISNTP